MYATIASTYKKISSSIRTMLDDLDDINITWKTSYTEILGIYKNEQVQATIAANNFSLLQESIHL